MSALGRVRHSRRDVLEPGDHHDLPEIRRLLESCRLPTAGVAENLERFVVAREAGKIVGCAGLELHRPYGLLRSVAVAPGKRGREVGKRLVRAVERRARELGLGELYLLTDGAEAFFARCGYEVTDREAAPPEIRESEEFRSLCPQTAVLMRREMELPGRARPGKLSLLSAWFVVLIATAAVLFVFSGRTTSGMLPFFWLVLLGVTILRALHRTRAFFRG